MGGLSANQPQCRITVRLEWTLLAEHMWHIQGTWPCFCLSRWIYQTYSSGPPQAHCWYQSSGDCLCTVWRSCPPSRCAPSEDRMFSHILDAYYLPLNPFATYIIWVWTDMDLNRSMACVQRAIQPWGRDSRVFFFFGTYERLINYFSRRKRTAAFRCQATAKESGCSGGEVFCVAFILWH